MERAILYIFDLDGTLRKTKEQAKKCRDAAVQAMTSIPYGIPATYEKTRATLEKVIKEQGSNSEEHFDGTIERIFEEEGILLSKEQRDYISSHGITAYHMEKSELMRPYDDAIPTINALISRGCKVCILTKGIPKKQWDKLIRSGLSKIIGFKDVWIVDENTDDTKERKLKEMLEYYEVNPEKAVMIGDRKDVDIKAAKYAGIKSVLVNGRETPGPEPDYEINSLKELLELDILKEN
jgi:FMN phosphatase YigB (HAD superfamily)